jgi:DNA repair exonuclease SbcCD ATPase subunit
VHQNEVQEIVRSPESLSSEILEMLGLSKSMHGANLEEQVETLLEELNSLKRWLSCNTKADRKITIQRNGQLISTIKTQSNKDRIERYQENQSSIAKNENSTKKLKILRDRLDSVIGKINNEINLANEDFDNSPIPSVNFTQQLSSIELLISNLDSQASKLTSDNKDIQQKLYQDGVEGDTTTLFEKVNEYQLEIDAATNKLQEIEEKENNLRELVEKRNSIIERIDESFNGQLLSIQGKWENLLSGKTGWGELQKELISTLLDDIKISGEIVFNVNKFYEKITPFLNGRKFMPRQDTTSQQRIRSALNINNYNDYKKLLRNEPIIVSDETHGLINLDTFLEQDFFNSNGNKNFLEVLFQEKQRNEYVKVLAKTTYQDKQPQELSIGQRGTLYVCLKLATDSFFDPFIFDQPEDDLDNAFIVEKLVPIFKKIKKYRQVIIVTHNANLVVNADAEQVIIANNDSEKLSYISGSLENPDIKSRICEVLEGGKEAFKKREQKYGLI